jgi:hypothetical protein
MSKHKQRRRVSEAQLAEAYQLAKDQGWTVTKFARHLGLSISGGWYLYHGFIYKDVARPNLEAQ